MVSDTTVFDDFFNEQITTVALKQGNLFFYSGVEALFYGHSI